MLPIIIVSSLQQMCQFSCGYQRHVKAVKFSSDKHLRLLTEGAR